MTLSRQLLSPGRLILSPAVEPGERPLSGMPSYGPSTLSNAGNRVQRSDVLTSVWDGSGPGLDLSFDGPGPGFKWRVERASVGAVSAGWTNCEVHAGVINPDNPFETLVDNSFIPNTDIADESSPIFVGYGQRLTFRFTGGAPGDDATARIQYTQEAL